MFSRLGNFFGNIAVAAPTNESAQNDEHYQTRLADCIDRTARLRMGDLKLDHATTRQFFVENFNVDNIHPSSFVGDSLRFQGFENSATDRENLREIIDRERALFLELMAHGVEGDKGGLETLFNIMVYGVIGAGCGIGSLVNGDPSLFAGPHGPFYVLLDDGVGSMGLSFSDLSELASSVGRSAGDSAALKSSSNAADDSFDLIGNPSAESSDVPSDRRVFYVRDLSKVGDLSASVVVGNFAESAVESSEMFSASILNPADSLMGSDSTLENGIPKDKHIAYLVPSEVERRQISEGLAQIRSKSILTSCESDEIKSKIMTYEELLQLDSRLDRKVVAADIKEYLQGRRSFSPR